MRGLGGVGGGGGGARGGGGEEERDTEGITANKERKNEGKLQKEGRRPSAREKGVCLRDGERGGGKKEK